MWRLRLFSKTNFFTNKSKSRRSSGDTRERCGSTLTYGSDTSWCEKHKSFHFPSSDQVQNMHNYPKLFLNPMHSGKTTFLYFKRIQKSANESHALDSDVPESNPHGEDEDQNCRSIVNPKFFRPMSWTLILVHFLWGGKEGGCYDSLSL